MLSVRRALLGVATVAALLAGGCGGVDQAASAQGVARNDLVAEMAATLSGTGTLTYRAEYRLSGGRTATLAQDPPRTAYVFPGGRVLLDARSLTTCQGMSCTKSAPTAGAPRAVERAGLVTPGTVLTLLNAAALDATVVSTDHDTTIAGHHATCLVLAGVDDPRAQSFTVCVTNDGVLGSFTGELDGAAVEMAMTTYAGDVPAGAFTLPAGARVSP